MQAKTNASHVADWFDDPAPAGNSPKPRLSMDQATGAVGGTLAILIGAVALTGWRLPVAPGLPAASSGIAIDLILTGLALVGLTTARRALTLGASGMAAFLAMVFASGGSHMPPQAALCFISLAGAFLFGQIGPADRRAGVLGAAALVSAVTGAGSGIGLVWGNGHAFGFTQLAPLSLETSGGLLLLGLASVVVALGRIEAKLPQPLWVPLGAGIFLAAVRVGLLQAFSPENEAGLSGLLRWLGAMLGAVAFAVFVHLALKANLQRKMLQAVNQRLEMEMQERGRVELGVQAANEQLETRVEDRTRELAAANAELRQQKEILQNIFDHMPVMINFVDQNNRIRMANREWEKTLGWSLEEVNRRNLDILEVNYPDREYREEVLNFVVNSHAEWRDFKTTVRDGSVIDTSWAMLHLSDGTGIGIGQDISTRKRAEEALRESEERFRELAENIHEVFWLRSADLKNVLYVSPMYQRVCGKTSESLYAAGLDLSEIHPEDRCGVMQMIDNFNGQEFEIEYRIITKDREVRWMRDRGFPIRNQAGEIYRIGGVAEDITDRKEAEERLKATSEQLRALSASLHSAREKEATRIAHQIHDDLGGVLTSLRWELESLEKTLESSDDQKRTPDVREKLATKLATMMRLTDTTIDVVRRIASELRPSILDDLGLMEAVEWQTQQFQARTGIECQCICSLDHLPLGSEQSTSLFRIVQEALTNILRHAHATKVEVRMAQEASTFMLTVTDNGRGITQAEKLSRTSLGLLGMQERAHLIGGRVEITGHTGTGTQLRIYVPAGERPGEKQPGEKQPGEKQPGEKQQ